MSPVPSAVALSAAAGALELTYTSFEGEQAEQCAQRLLALSTACGWAQYDLAKWQSLLACGSEIFVAQRADGSYVGCALRTSYDVDGDEKRGFGMLGMMLVDPALRGGGIAKRLLATFQERVQGLGQTCGMGVASDLGLPVYLKRGYRPVTPGASAARVSAPSSVVATLKSQDDIEVILYRDGSSKSDGLTQLLALDSEVTGLRRSKQLTKLSQSEGSFVAVASQGGRTIGALLAVVDTQTGTLNLGPILGTEASATKMITTIAHEFPDGSVAFFVHDHRSYFESLREAGFTTAPVVFTGTMVLGDLKMPGDRARYVAIITPALG